MKEVHCAGCGLPLPDLDQAPEPRPCPRCGDERTSIRLCVSDSAQVSESVWLTQSTENTAVTRVQALNSAIGAVVVALDEGKVEAAQAATKQALEAIHELDDGRRRRSEWTQDGWKAADIDLWLAHVAARNAAHHTSSSIVALHSGTAQNRILTWEINPEAIEGLHSGAQAAAYQRGLAGQPVLDGFWRVATLVGTAVRRSR